MKGISEGRSYLLLFGKVSNDLLIDQPIITSIRNIRRTCSDATYGTRSKEKLPGTGVSNRSPGTAGIVIPAVKRG